MTISAKLGRPAFTVPTFGGGSFPAGANAWSSQPCAVAPAAAYFEPSKLAAAEELNYQFKATLDTCQSAKTYETTFADFANFASVQNWRLCEAGRVLQIRGAAVYDGSDAGACIFYAGDTRLVRSDHPDHLVELSGYTSITRWQCVAVSANYLFAVGKVASQTQPLRYYALLSRSWQADPTFPSATYPAHFCGADNQFLAASSVDYPATDGLRGEGLITSGSGLISVYKNLTSTPVACTIPLTLTNAPVNDAGASAVAHRLLSASSPAGVVLLGSTPVGNTSAVGTVGGVFRLFRCANPGVSTDFVEVAGLPVGPGSAVPRSFGLVYDELRSRFVLSISGDSGAAITCYLYTSADGLTWSLLSSAAASVSAATANRAFSLADLGCAAGGVLYGPGMELNSSVPVGSRGARIYASPDGGATWQIVGVAAVGSGVGASVWCVARATRNSTRGGVFTRCTGSAPGGITAVGAACEFVPLFGGGCSAT